MEKIKIFINDQAYEVEKGRILIEICRDNGIYIPSLCYFPGNEPFAGCRLCVVELRGDNWYKLVASCEYPVQKTVRIYTDSRKVRNSRKLSAELLLARVPQAGDFLEGIIRQPVKSRFEPVKSDNEKCLLCGLCCRACQKFGPSAISINGRGADKVVSTPFNEQSNVCVACGICADICPTRAIEMEEDDNYRKIWFQEAELITCPACGKKHMTQKTWQFLTQELGLPENEMLLCEDCRKTSVAESIFGCLKKVATHT